MKLVQLLMILRGWVRSALSTFISLVSLGMGLLCSTILLLFVLGEYRIADSMGKEEGAYLLEVKDVFVEGQVKYNFDIYKDVPMKMADRLPEVEDWTVFTAQRVGGWQYDESPDWDGDATVAATPGFARLFNVKMELGSLDSVLAYPDQIAITRTYANQIFPNKEPIGQSITFKGRRLIPNTYQSENYENVYNVTAIIDDSEPTFIKLRALCQLGHSDLQSQGQAGSYHGALRLKKGTVDTVFCSKAAADTVILQNGDKEKFRLTALNRAYFQEPKRYSVFHSRDEQTLWIGVTVAFIILIIAAFNYINISMMRSEQRLKNLAGQRIMGASKWAVRLQILADTAMTVLVAFGLAIVFIEPAMKLFNGFMGSTLTLASLFDGRNLPYIIGLLLILIALPAMSLIAKFSIRSPLEVFKNPRGTRANVMQTLVVAQFAMSVILIAFSLNVSRQMEYVTTQIAQSESILMIAPPLNRSFSKEFIDKIKSDASTTAYVPGTITSSMKISNGKQMCFGTSTQPSYFGFFGIKMLDGKIFDTVTTGQVVVNEAFVKGWELDDNPIGHEFEFNGLKRRIVGVCEDVAVENVNNKIQATIYFLDERPHYWTFHLKFSGSIEDKIARINQLYMAEDSLLKPAVKTLEGFLKEQNPEITRMQTMIELFTTVSVLLTALGMFGLAWYMVARRKKEIALRKVHGSTVGQVVGLLCQGFLKWVLIAIVVALPLGFYISGRWLEGFAYKVDNSLWVLLITAIAVSLLTFITVIFQTVRAATANPANAIKTE